MLRNDTICALATPAGMGAIAVIRLSGDEALTIADRIFTSPNGEKKLNAQKGYTVHFGQIVADNQTIDEVLATVFKAPHSFTGEDSVEISCHGSVYIQEKILQLLLANGARLADPGEFTMRAFINGKMDLSQAEAVADLISAESQAAHQVALQQMRGGFSHEIDALRESLINFASLIELELDFAEEDVEFADRSNLIALLQEIKLVLKRLMSSFAMGNAIKNGIPVAIVGAPNAGKSTLLNALLNEERAIVSHIAGTTRDTVEDEIHLRGLTFRFIDTAGLRHTSDEIEHIGIQKAFDKIDHARVILYLYDAAKPPRDLETHLQAVIDRAANKPLLVLANKADDAMHIPPPKATSEHFLTISAKNKVGLDALQEVLLEVVGANQLNNNAVIVTNARHYEALNNALESIEGVLNGISMQLTTDLLAEDVREALRQLGRITGAIDADKDILGTIFGKFCIGK